MLDILENCHRIFEIHDLQREIDEGSRPKKMAAELRERRSFLESNKGNLGPDLTIDFENQQPQRTKEHDLLRKTESGPS